MRIGEVKIMNKSNLRVRSAVRFVQFVNKFRPIIKNYK
jgi:phosphotransferase system HPr-like phosphotransfer protein